VTLHIHKQIENTETNPQMYKNSIYDRGSISDQKEKMNSSINATSKKI
jgi:hypothetical protein